MTDVAPITPSARLATLLDPTRLDAAADVVRRYFSTPATGGFTGAYFERFCGGGDRPEVAKAFTAEDVVAVSMLSVQVEGRPALDLLVHRADRLNALLSTIPTDTTLASLAAAELGASWTPRVLFEELLRIPGIGATTASKLLARKRPHLVPVYDTVVDSELSLVKGRLWRPLHAWLVADDHANERHLERVRERAGVPDVSVLRVFDVLTWMTGRENVVASAPHDDTPRAS